MPRSTMSRDTTASGTGDSRQVPATADDAMSQAHMLEEASYDLALRIISLESQDGKTEQVLLARAELRQMDEHLTWVDHHRHHASEGQVLAAVDQARSNASHILAVLPIV